MQRVEELLGELLALTQAGGAGVDRSQPLVAGPRELNLAVGVAGEQPSGGPRSVWAHPGQSGSVRHASIRAVPGALRPPGVPLGAAGVVDARRAAPSSPPAENPPLAGRVRVLRWVTSYQLVDLVPLTERDLACTPRLTIPATLSILMSLVDRGCGVPGVDPPVIDGLGGCPGVRGREPRRVPGGGRRCDSLSWSWAGTPRPRCLRGWGCYPSPPQSPPPPPQLPSSSPPQPPP